MDVSRGSINALPNANDLPHEVYVTDAKRENFPDAQTKNRRHRQNGAEWFGCCLTTAVAVTCCALVFASREKAIISQWEVGVGMVAGGGPMARLPHLIGRNRALELLLSSEDIRTDQAEAYGYINRALPDGDLDAFVEALATRIAKFDKWAIAQTKRLVNTGLPPDVELGAGWDACIGSLGRPAAQNGIKALMALGFHNQAMSKIGSASTWAKSRAGSAPGAILNSRTWRIAAVRSESWRTCFQSLR